MANIQRNFTYNGRVHGLETNIYYIKNNGKKLYFILKEFPNTAKNKSVAAQLVTEFNEKHKRQAEVLYRKDKDGRVHAFINAPCTVIDALREEISVEREIRKDNKIIDKINRSKTSGKVSSDKKCRPVGEKIKAKIALALVAVTLFGVSFGALINGIDIDSNAFGPDIEASETMNPETIKNPDTFYETQLNPDTTENIESTQTPETSEREEEYVDIDLETFKYGTYLNSAGVRMIETEDAFKIAEACYNYVAEAIEEYNKSVPENKRYSYDPTDFDSSHMMARWTRESSLILDVDPQANEDVRKAEDYGDRCRGPFKMSKDAINEANAIAEKVLKKKVIESEKDIYDPIKQCIASYLFNVQATEYLESYGIKDVTSRHLGPAYLYGSFGVYRDGRENSFYANDIEFYASCYSRHKSVILSGKSTEEEKRTAVRKLTFELWDKPDWSKVQTTQTSELGE